MPTCTRSTPGTPDADRGDAALPRRRRPRGEDHLCGAVQLHRLAAPAHPLHRAADGHPHARDTPAAVQPALPGERIQSHPRRTAQPRLPAALVPARRRLPHRQVPARHHPAPDTRAGSDDKLYQWVSAEYAAFDRNWHTIGTVIGTAHEIGATPSQVALAWAADQPSVAAPIVGARTLTHRTENLGAAELHLDADTTVPLNTVSAPQHGGYPYGGFGIAQRSRDFHGSKAQTNLIDGGSDAPLGHA